MTTILIIDDEPSILQLVSAYLETEGYIVHLAEDGQQGLERFRRYQPALVVLDIMLPGMDGLEVLQQIRRESQAYVLLLTARSNEVDRVVGLTVGADDYLTKPFSPHELVARVKAILRRDRQTKPLVVTRFRHIVIDEERHEVWHDDELIELTALEFKLLKLLAAHPGIVMTREQLIEKIWGYDFYGDERIVDVHIRHIRQKLEANPDEPYFIQTVRGVGYKFVDETL